MDRRDMVLILHIPEWEDDCAIEMIRQVDRLLDVCADSLITIRRDWQVNYDDLEGEPAGSHQILAAEGKEYFHNWEVTGKRKMALATWLAIFQDKESSRRYMFSGRECLVAYPKHYEAHIAQKERYIMFHMPLEAWRFIDKEAFINCVKEACAALNVTYACMDADIRTGGLYGGRFRLLSDATDEDDIEKSLPGVYWFQIVSQDMVERTGSLDEIARTVPCERAEVFECGGRRMLLMQTTREFEKTTHKKRLAMRTFFDKSLYRIVVEGKRMNSLTNFDAYSDMGKSMRAIILRDMKLIPLTNEEIAALLATSGQ